jgi:hypothetical protein
MRESAKERASGVDSLETHSLLSFDAPTSIQTFSRIRIEHNMKIKRFNPLLLLHKNITNNNNLVLFLEIN